MVRKTQSKWPDDFLKMASALHKDSRLIWRASLQDKSDNWRRAYIRAVFSEIDALISGLKDGIRETQKVDDLPLSDDDQKKLDEFFVRQSENGKPIKKVFYPPFPENVAFTLDLYAYSNYVFSRIDKQSEEWQCLLKSSKIRNRITHPKTPSDLILTPDDIRMVHQTELWFQKAVISLLEASVKALRGQLKGLRKAKAGLPRGPNPPCQ